MRTDVQASNTTVKPGPSPAPESLAVAVWLEGGLATLDEAGSITEINEPLSHWLAQSPSNLKGKSFWNLLGNLHPEWKPALAQAQQTKGPFARATLQTIANDSAPSHWFALEFARNRAGGFVRLNSMLPPVAELDERIPVARLNAESARRESVMRLIRAEAQLERLLRRGPCVLFSQRPDFGIHTASANILDVTGLEAAEWASQPQRFWELVHEGDAGELRRQFAQVAQTASVISNSFRVRHAVTGRVSHVIEHRQPVMSPDGLLAGYEVMWLDVTRQTVAERRLSAAAWKETLAVLTLGMAHDFRNIMAGIHSLSETFLAQLEDGSRFKEGLSLIKQNSMQASLMVQRMINLHLGQAGERSYHDLNELARDLADLVSKIIPKRIRIVTELADKSLPVYADVVLLRQVVINLMLNATDAMPKNGTLTLRVSRCEKMPKIRHLKGTAPKMPCLCMAIEDTGCGIKERHLDTIFDPFFTTKAKGSGLGLYNARNAMEKHQGAISVESEEGKGSRFRLWLPEADFSESTVSGAAAQRPAERRSILLLGQSGELLEKTAEFLRSNNYYVVVATAPETLPEILQSGDYPLDGVVLLAGAKDPLTGMFLAETRQQRRDLKIALKLAGCSVDDVESRLLNDADLVLNPDLSEADILERISKFLS